MRVQAEVSLYPLRTDELSEPIRAFCQSLNREGLAIETGSMSTTICGDCDDVFGALRDAFAGAARDHQVVLVVKLSSACPDSDQSGQAGASSVCSTVSTRLEGKSRMATFDQEAAPPYV